MPKNDEQKVVKVATQLAENGMNARMFETFDDAEAAADYCINLAKKILDYEEE